MGWGRGLEYETHKVRPPWFQGTDLLKFEAWGFRMVGLGLLRLQVQKLRPRQGQSLPPLGSHWLNGPGAPAPRFSVTALPPSPQTMTEVMTQAPTKCRIVLDVGVQTTALESFGSLGYVYLMSINTGCRRTCRCWKMMGLLQDSAGYLQKHLRLRSRSMVKGTKIGETGK